MKSQQLSEATDAASCNNIFYYYMYVVHACSDYCFSIARGYYIYINTAEMFPLCLVSLQTKLCSDSGPSECAYYVAVGYREMDGWIKRNFIGALRISSRVQLHNFEPTCSVIIQN